MGVVSGQKRNALAHKFEVDGYRIERVLGAGGFGITYLAVEVKTERRVAIKEYFPLGVAHRNTAQSTVHPNGADDAEEFAWGLSRFLEEAKLLLTINHPGVVRTLRYTEANGTAYIVMDYVDGVSLSALLRRGGTLDQDEIIEFALPLLDGLQAVHAAGVLHRDIKPDNIFIRHDNGRPVLLDFGAARLLTRLTHSVIASPGYCPPEQYQSQGARRPSADLYGVGATLYRCMTGAPPPDAAERVTALAFKHVDPLMPVSQAAKRTYSQELVVAVDSSLELDPTLRPQSADSLKASLLGRTVEGANGPSSADATRAPSVRAVDADGSGATSAPGRGKPVLLRPAANAGQSTADLDTLPPRPQAPRISKTGKQPVLLYGGIAGLVLTGCAIAATIIVSGTDSKSIIRDCSRCPEMVVVPAGRYLMGSPATEQGRDVDGDEGPQHFVTIPKAFAIGKYEVTFEEWDVCVADGACPYRPDENGWGRGRRPVINVAWSDVATFIAWLSKKTGKTYRLPSETEWEYAARAGTTTAYSTGSSISTDQANFDDSVAGGIARRQTLPVGSFPPNPFGLFDVHGNVAEWTEDCWNGGYSGAPSDGRAWVQGDCSRHVIRGYSFAHGPDALRSASRSGPVGDYRSEAIGFRLARDLE